MLTSPHLGSINSPLYSFAGGIMYIIREHLTSDTATRERLYHPITTHFYVRILFAEPKAGEGEEERSHFVPRTIPQILYFVSKRSSFHPLPSYTQTNPTRSA